MDNFIFYQRVLKLHQERLDQVEAALLNGSAGTLEDYKSLVQLRCEMIGIMNNVRKLYGEHEKEVSNE